MDNSYKEQEEFINDIIPSPEYNRIIKAYVVNSTINVGGIIYVVTNSNDTDYKVPIVLFPDGTAEVLKKK